MRQKDAATAASGLAEREAAIPMKEKLRVRAASTGKGNGQPGQNLVFKTGATGATRVTHQETRGKD